MSTTKEPSVDGRLDVDGRCLEVVDIPAAGSPAPPLVFLHEGLGSARLWKSFPERLAAATGRRAVLYSRAGYGGSDPAPLPRTERYMHDEALEVLPALLERLDIERPVLVGHSDGASIALIHAGGADRPVAGLVLLAPHVFVEERSLSGIRAARRAYVEGDLRARLARYHADVDTAFWGWNDVWLSETFATWNIEEYLPGIPWPSLVIQAEDDPYGTLAQVETITRRSGGPVGTRILAQCGHAPHVERPEETLEAVRSWLSVVRR